MAAPELKAPVDQVPHRTDSNILVEGESNFVATRNVLLPIDDTDDSERACNWAATAFYRPGDVFHLLHIVEEPHMIHIWPGMYLPPDDDAEEEEVEEAVKMVRRRFTKLLASRKIPFDVSIVVAGTEPSQVATVIRDKADEIKASAVVMARHPKTKFQSRRLLNGHAGLPQEFWRGSVSAEAAHKCHAPTIVI